MYIPNIFGPIWNSISNRSEDEGETSWINKDSSEKVISKWHCETVEWPQCFCCHDRCAADIHSDAQPASFWSYLAACIRSVSHYHQRSLCRSVRLTCLLCAQMGLSCQNSKWRSPCISDSWDPVRLQVWRYHACNFHHFLCTCAPCKLSPHTHPYTPCGARLERALTAHMHAHDHAYRIGSVPTCPCVITVEFIECLKAVCMHHNRMCHTSCLNCRNCSDLSMFEHAPLILGCFVEHALWHLLWHCTGQCCTSRPGVNNSDLFGNLDFHQFSREMKVFWEFQERSNY